MGEAKKAVSVPAEVYERLSELLDASSADSVDELVSRILRDWVSKESSQASHKPKQVSDQDEKIVEERLKSLGYS